MKTKETERFHVGVYEIFIQDNKILLIKKGKEGSVLEFFSLDEMANIPLTQKLKQAFLSHRKILESLI